jgi:hypothetical protein
VHLDLDRETCVEHAKRAVHRYESYPVDDVAMEFRQQPVESAPHLVLDAVVDVADADGRMVDIALDTLAERSEYVRVLTAVVFPQEPITQLVDVPERWSEENEERSGKRTTAGRWRSNGV